MTPSAAETSAKRPWNLYSPGRRIWFLVILFLVSLSSRLDQALISVLVEPIKTEFHATDAMMGGLTGFAFAACYALVSLPAARISDRGDRRIVIAVSIAAWSLMTVISGFTRSFWALAAARVGVGIGEAGAGPSSGALIADYYPPERRAGAIASGLVSVAVGGALASIFGALIAERYGWRTAFLALGAPGLVIALLSYVGLSEPRRQIPDLALASSETTTSSKLKALARKPAFVLLLIGMSLYTGLGSGLAAWAPAYTMRVLGLSLSKMGATTGLATAFATLVGTVGGGLFADRLAAKDRRLLFWLPGLAMLATTPIWVWGFWSSSFSTFILVLIGCNVVLTSAFPAILSGLQMIIRSEQRATALAVVGFFGTFLGTGGGPLLTGAISDVLSPMVGGQGLRFAMIATILLLIPSGLATFAAGSLMHRDLED